MITPEDIRRLSTKPSILRIEENLFTARQRVIDCLKPEQKETFLASEDDFTTKMELFKSIKALSTALYRICMHYSHSLELLALTESDLSQTFRDYSSKCHPSLIQLVSETSKLFAVCSSQRTMLRRPINSLLDEVRTFQTKAISDTMLTIKRMYSARSNYKASLLWMQTCSNSLDPEDRSRLEKYRKIQSSVKRSMKRYEQLKSDVTDKIHMLCASRCSMFSNALSEYCKALENFYTNAIVYCKPLIESAPVDFQFEVIEGLRDITVESEPISLPPEDSTFSLLNLSDNEDQHGAGDPKMAMPEIADEISDLCQEQPGSDDLVKEQSSPNSGEPNDIDAIRPSHLLFGNEPRRKQAKPFPLEEKKTDWDKWLKDLGSSEPNSDLSSIFGKGKEGEKL